MKEMKKSAFRHIIADFALFIAWIPAAGCGRLDESLQLDKTYVYKDISFKKAENLTFEELSSLVPMGAVGEDNHPIDTINELEQCIAENIDTYSVILQTENGSERVFIKPNILSLRAAEGNPYVANGYSLWLTFADREGEYCYGAKREGDSFTFADAYAPNDFYFSDAEFHQELMLHEKFSIVYNYRLG